MLPLMSCTAGIAGLCNLCLMLGRSSWPRTARVTWSLLSDLVIVVSYLVVVSSDLVIVE